MAQRFRNKQSGLAGVIDAYGGWHTIVAPSHTFHHHVRPGQVLVPVPDFKITEPVPWDKIPLVINTAKAAIDRFVATRNVPPEEDEEAIRLYRIRETRTFQRQSLNLYDIVET